jgi:hypothetical protein
MTNIPLRQMIDSGSWFNCEGQGSFMPRRFFRIRFTSFRPVEISEIDEPQRIEGFNIKEGRLWLLSFSVVNLGKEGFSAWDVKTSFLIVDQDNCAFEEAHDTYLSCVSAFSVKTGVRRYSGTAPALPPKMVTEGDALYLLPDEESPQYSLTMKKTGTIEEI